MMQDEITLYDYASSPCARRVKMTLIEKGLSFNTQIIELPKMEQKSPEYLRINPNGLVPALSHDGRIFFESGVITDYLEDMFPQYPLYPMKRGERLKVKNWQYIELAMAKKFRSLMYARVMGPMSRLACDLDEYMAIAQMATDNEAHLAWQEKIWRLQVLDQSEQAQLQKQLYHTIDLVERELTGRTYLVGQQFSFADIALYPRLLMYPSVGIDINEYDFPNVHAWTKRLEERHCVQSTRTDTEKALALAVKTGLLDLVNYLAYKSQSDWTLVDKLAGKLLRPLARKATNVTKDSLKPLEAKKLVKGQHVPSSMTRLSSLNCLKDLERAQIREGADGLVLYANRFSPITKSLRLLLDSLELRYEYFEIDLLSVDSVLGDSLPSDVVLDSDKTREFRRVNPSLEVPILIHGDTVIVDPEVAAEYIVGFSKAFPLFCQDPVDQAQIRMWNAFDAGLHKEYQSLFYTFLRRSASGTSNSNYSKQEISGLYTLRQCEILLEEKMQLFDEALEDKSFLVAERFSYADLLLCTRLDSFSMLGVDECLKGKNNIEGWLNRSRQSVLRMTAQLPNAKNTHRANIG